MLNQDRIQIMTKLAIYEQNEGKKEIPMGKYHRRDYVALELIKSFFCATIAFGVLFLLSILHDAETWLDNLYGLNYQSYAIRLILLYLAFVTLFQLIAWGVYQHRYKAGQKNLKSYRRRLKKLEKLYAQEEELEVHEENNF